MGHHERLLADGWPAARGRSLYTSGRSAVRPAVGTEIEVRFDHDEGALAFRIDGGALLPALDGFPPGAGLRPWAQLFGGTGHSVDSIRFSPAYLLPQDAGFELLPEPDVLEEEAAEEEAAEEEAAGLGGLEMPGRGSRRPERRAVGTG